jgi:hypothetical protein
VLSGTGATGQGKRWGKVHEGHNAGKDCAYENSWPTRFVSTNMGLSTRGQSETSRFNEYLIATSPITRLFPTPMTCTRDYELAVKRAAPQHGLELLGCLSFEFYGSYTHPYDNSSAFFVGRWRVGIG